MVTRNDDRSQKIIAANLIGDFLRSKIGFEYLIVFKDSFSRSIICLPIRQENVINVKKALENVARNSMHKKYFYLTMATNLLTKQ